MMKCPPVYLFILLLILLSALTVLTAGISHDMEHAKNFSVHFHLPREISEPEKADLPPIPGNVRVTKLAPLRQSINWTEVIAGGPYDVVVIGDSFTGGCRSGLYLIDRFSADSNLSILNIYTNYNAYFEHQPNKALIFLTNNGFFQEVGAQMVILGTAERGNGISPLQNANLSAFKPLSEENHRKIPGKQGRDLVSIINQEISRLDNFFRPYSDALAMMKTRILNLVIPWISGQTINGDIHFARLTKPMFSHDRYADTLLYYKADIAYTKLNTTSLAISVNGKLNEISRKLMHQNITLIYLPGVSSYTSHHPYILNPQYERTTYYDTLESLNKSYVFINTKEISDRLAAEGMIDLHGIGDVTHWNWPLTERIADETKISRFLPGNLQAGVNAGV